MAKAKLKRTYFTEDAPVLGILSRLQKKCGREQYSDVIDSAGNQYVDLVMEGGGVLGIALVGYTYVLEKMGLRFIRIGGTSAGSINALLLAGLGPKNKPKSEKVVDLIANLDMWQFVDGDSDARDFVRTLLSGAGKIRLTFKAIQILDNLNRDLGLNPGKTFLEWLEGVLDANGVSTVTALNQLMQSGDEELRRRDGSPYSSGRRPRLALIAADVTTESKVDFPRMADLYWRNSRKVHPAQFVRASMSIPYFFHPCRVDNIPQGEAAVKRWQKLAGFDASLPESSILVDGGIMSNFPIDLFHRPKSTPSAPTFGVKLGKGSRVVQRVETAAQLGGAAFNAARHCLDFDFLARHPDYRHLVAHIDTGTHNWLNFDMQPEQKRDLFVRGAEAAERFLMGFDWQNYKQIRENMAAANKTAGL